MLSAVQLLLALGADGLERAHAAARRPTSPYASCRPTCCSTTLHLAQLGDELAAEGADVVVVQEVTDEVLAELERSALWTDYPYRATAPEPRFEGAATFSRFPITHSETIQVAGHPMLLTDLETPAGPLRVVNVHTVAPLTGTGRSRLGGPVRSPGRARTAESVADRARRRLQRHARPRASRGARERRRP